MTDVADDDGTALVLPVDPNEEEYGAPFVSAKDVRQSRALRAILAGKSIIEACKHAGVGYSAWYHWKEDPEFERLYHRALSARVDELETSSLEDAKKDPALAMFFLKSWKPDRYREKTTITLVSPMVQDRLERQADAILVVCQELLDRDTAALVASTIAGRLREIWV